MYSFNKTGILLCICMYVYAHDEKDTRARCKDPHAHSTSGVASDACLAVFCLYRIGLRR